MTPHLRLGKEDSLSCNGVRLKGRQRSPDDKRVKIIEIPVEALFLQPFLSCLFSVGNSVLPHVVPLDQPLQCIARRRRYCIRQKKNRMIETVQPQEATANPSLSAYKLWNTAPHQCPLFTMPIYLVYRILALVLQRVPDHIYDGGNNEAE